MSAETSYVYGNLSFDKYTLDIRPKPLHSLLMPAFDPIALAEFRTYHFECVDQTLMVDLPFEDWLYLHVERFAAFFPHIAITPELFRLWMQKEYGPTPCDPMLPTHTLSHADL